MTSRTFVLVHGACDAGWTWRPVALHLRARGHTVHTPTLPGLNTGDQPANVHLADTVDYLAGYVERADLRQVVLVGHSWSGFPVSGAAARLATRISRLVYWNAFVPHSGETMIDLCPPQLGDVFRASVAASSDNSVKFPFEVFCTALMQDATAETQKTIYSLLERQPFHTISEPLDLTEWERLQLPSSYVLGTDDISMPPGEFAWAPRFPQRLPGAPLIYTAGSHLAQLTQPESLAEALIRAAEG
ncbi:pimeloyl-ACP methyl ester carboxylesterase [Amycolatopsis echigonensis]|uniref:Pimeloyl-ACP methyl ester carboxylesterase n=1 Tax=Amycolatopsis echigonensis TaxID=2576905 RepID=A0A2N3WUV0_9PSEU|nr:alpha/beta hydrolase [Amycolatopsis niigatensis]PKV97643.1 pimeloyl-ACP methyl ester carboxylesterase [Amycolatopsis niigatensis]